MDLVKNSNFSIIGKGIPRKDYLIVDENKNKIGIVMELQDLQYKRLLVLDM